MGWYERTALYLWRDRGGYDVRTSGMTEDYNVSLRTRFKWWRKDRRKALASSAPWLVPALIAAAVAIGVVFLTHYLDASKADQQVKANAGELLLRCTKQADGILRCAQVVEAKH